MAGPLAEARLHCPRLLLRYFDLHWELLIVFAGLPLTYLADVGLDLPLPLGSLRALVLQCLSLEFSLDNSLHSGLLLALRPLASLSEASGGLVELGFAFVDGFALGRIYGFGGGFRILFLREEERGLNVYFAFEWDVYFGVVDPVGVGLLVEWIPLALG